MMVFLAKIGNSMAFALKYLYSRIGCRWCRIRRKKEELSAKGELQENSVHPEDITSQEINQAGDMAHEIDPARTGLLLSVVLSFFFVYIFVITKYGNRNPRYVRFEAAGNVASIGEPFEMKPQ